jgi:hypothetical protein
VVGFFPCGLLVAEKGEQATAAEFGAGSLDEEGAPAAGANDGVDFADEFVGEDDVCSL